MIKIQTAEEWLTENVGSESWNNLDERIEDFISTNNVLDYMHQYALYYGKELLAKSAENAMINRRTMGCFNNHSQSEFNDGYVLYTIDKQSIIETEL